MKNLFLLSLILLLSACGSHLDGTYTSSDGKTHLTFESNGKVIVNGGSEISYKLEADKINLQGLPIVLTLQKDGSLDGGVVFGKLTKN